jgi:hypothetical protein
VNGSVFLLIIILGPLALALWAYEKGKRVIAWLVAAAAFLLVIGVPMWRDSLASLITTPRSLGILGGVTVVSGLAFWFEAIRGHKHHRTRSPLVGVVFATSLALTLGSLPRIIRQVTRSPRATSHALSRTMSQIQSGKAAAAISPHQGHTVLIAVAVALVLLVLMARRAEKRRKPGFARAAIPAGGGRGPAPSGRPSLPAGKGRR